MTEATAPVPGAFAEYKKRSAFVDVVTRIVRGKPLGTIGAVIVLVMFLTGIFADVLAPYGFKEPHLADRLSPPGTEGYLLGTDGIGRDMLSRVIYGARVSMIIGLAATALSLAVSSFVGILSGFFGGKVDIFVQRFVDAWMCFPWLIVMITIMSLVGSGMYQLIFVLGIGGGIGGSRVVRAAVIGIKENVYMQAATAVGCSTPRVVFRHILPNIMAPLIIIFTTGMGGMILAEASLSFLGYGIPPPTPSWGGMLAGIGRSYMLQAPWLIFWPGLALSVAVFGINMLGDALRDVLDPRLRGGLGRYAGVKRKRRGSSSKMALA